MDYPVLDILPQLKKALEIHPVVLLQAPPGAGKSTVLPLHLLEETWLNGHKMIMLEPRRLAARTVAERLSSTLEEPTGKTIGYSVRFDSKVSSSTRIHIVTEGILARMLQEDNAMDGTGLIIFDEFHERSLHADLALALSLQCQQLLRPDLKILIMSATLDTAAIGPKLNAPVITSEGRQFPVERRYLDLDPTERIQVRMSRAIRKALTETTGDILAFLPGAGEIIRTQELLEEHHVSASVHVLYGDLPNSQQQRALMPDPSGTRKIILSTSIAETSLTIEGVSVVIDSGLARVPRYDVRSGLTRLDTVKVTRDSAEQRAGRAGRLGPGVCYRLWPETTQHQLVASRKPEIEEADLAPIMLELFQWGIRNINELFWITLPPSGAVSQAIELLTQLGAITSGKITERGKAMLRLPTHPRISHMLLDARDNGVQSLQSATDLAAILEEKDPMDRNVGADLSIRVELLRKWRKREHVQADRGVLERIEKLASNWRRIMKVEVSNEIVADEMVGELVAAAYPERIARQESKHSERYKLAGGRVVRLPDHDPLTRETWLAVAHLDAGSSEGKIHLAAPVNEKDLHHLTVDQDSIRWDSERKQVVGTREKRIGNLVLESKPLQTIDSAERIRIILETIKVNGLRFIGWSDTEIQWQSRVMSLRKWRGDQWPDVSDESLLNTIDKWLSPYLTDISKQSEIERLDLQTILNSSLPWELQSQLDKLAPSKLEVPSGSHISLHYSIDGSAPMMEVRLQEMFGQLDTPAVNEARNRIVIHLLSPGYKPVQVTQDLRSFWTNMYHEVKNELKRRYPKHSWPDDPWTAKAVRGVVRKHK